MAVEHQGLGTQGCAAAGGRARIRGSHHQRGACRHDHHARPSANHILHSPCHPLESSVPDRGWQAVDSSASAFATHFLPYFLVAIINLGRFGNGGYTLAGLAMNWGSFAIHLRATLTVVLGSRIGFVVTPKRGRPGLPWGALAPNLLAVTALLGASVAAIARGPNPATLNTVVFALVGAVLVGLVVPFAVVQARAIETPSRDTRSAVAPAEGS